MQLVVSQPVTKKTWDDGRLPLLRWNAYLFGSTPAAEKCRCSKRDLSYSALLQQPRVLVFYLRSRCGQLHGAGGVRRCMRAWDEKTAQVKELPPRANVISSWDRFLAPLTHLRISAYDGRNASTPIPCMKPLLAKGGPRVALGNRIIGREERPGERYLAVFSR